MYDYTRQRPDTLGLFWLASEQAGYFTAEQARSYGLSKQLVSHHIATGRFIHIRRGLYRFRDYPSSPREEVMAAWLAVGKEDTVVSHESALDLLDLSAVVPNSIHLLVPRARRGTSAMPGVTLHTSTHPPERNEIVVRRGMRVTAPIRTILDAAEAGTAPEQIVTAVEQARARGMLVPARMRQAAHRRGRRVEHLVGLALGDGV